MVTTPTGASGSLKFKPPLDFEDVSQMVEWLILIESKLQPQKIIVGDFVHLKKLLKDIQVYIYTDCEYFKMYSVTFSCVHMALIFCDTFVRSF